MFSFSRKDGDGERLVVVTVLGSGVVSGGLVRLSLNKPPNILFSTRARFPYHPDTEMDHYERSMLTAFLDVLLEVQSSGMAAAREIIPGATSPEGVIGVLASPWYHSLSRVVSYEQQKSFTVSEELVDQLVDGALIDFLGSEKEVDRQTWLERYATDVRVNGYSTNTPLGKRGRELSFALYASLPYGDVVARAEEIIEQVFNPELATEWHALDIVAFSVLRDLSPDSDDFLLFDVSAEVTEVSIARHDALVASFSFPIGTRTLARESAEGDDVPVEERESRLKMAIEGTEVGTSKEKLKQMRTQWLKEVRAVLSEESDAPVPTNAYVLAEPPFARWLANGLSDPQLSELTLSNQPIAATAALQKLLRDGCDMRGNVTANPFIMLGAIFAAREIASTLRDSDAILNR